MDTERLRRQALDGDRQALHALLTQLRRAGNEEAATALLGELARPLSDWLVVGQPVAPLQAGALVGALLEALEPLHREGRAWLDLHASRIFVASRPAAAPWHAEALTVLDLGPPLRDWPLASGVGPATLPGEPRSRSPELLAGVHDLDPRHDVYVAGVLLWELLAGARLWPGDEARLAPGGPRVELGVSHESPGARLPANARHRPLERVALAALEPNRLSRFASATHMGLALEDAMRASPWLEGSALIGGEPSAPVALYGVSPMPPPPVPVPAYGMGPERRARGPLAWVRRLFGRS